MVPSLALTKWPSMLFVLSDVAPPAFSFGARGVWGVRTCAGGRARLAGARGRCRLQLPLRSKCLAGRSDITPVMARHAGWRFAPLLLAPAASRRGWDAFWNDASTRFCALTTPGMALARKGVKDGVALPCKDASGGCCAAGCRQRHAAQPCGLRRGFLLGHNDAGGAQSCLAGAASQPQARRRAH